MKINLFLQQNIFKPLNFLLFDFQISNNVDKHRVECNHCKLKDRPTLPANVIVVRTRRNAAEDVILLFTLISSENFSNQMDPSLALKTQTWRCCLVPGFQSAKVSSAALSAFDAIVVPSSIPITCCHTLFRPDVPRSYWNYQECPFTVNFSPSFFNLHHTT